MGGERFFQIHIEGKNVEGDVTYPTVRAAFAALADSPEGAEVVEVDVFNKVIDHPRPGTPEKPTHEQRLKVKRHTWSRGEKIALATLAVAVLAVIASFFIPEVRTWVGLEKKLPVTARLETSKKLPEQQAAPPPVVEGKSNSGQHLRTKIVGNNVAKKPQGASNNKKADKPPVQLNIAPNGIAIGGGIVNNPTVINNGPPNPRTPTVTICTSASVMQGGQPSTIITFTTDNEIIEPWYALFFDGPVLDGKAELGDGRGAFGFLNSRAKLPDTDRSYVFKLTSVNFGLARWLPGVPIKVTIPSNTPVKLVKTISGSGEASINGKVVFSCGS